MSHARRLFQSLAIAQRAFETSPKAPAILKHRMVCAAIVATALSELSWPSSKRVHWLQPVDEQCTVVHTALIDLPAEADLLPVLRAHNAELARVRNLAESRHQKLTVAYQSDRRLMESNRDGYSS